MSYIRSSTSIRGSSWSASRTTSWVSLASFFFFSSRRRHTRSDRDWSSDVCSSDLMPTPRAPCERSWTTSEPPATQACASTRGGSTGWTCRQATGRYRPSAGRKRSSRSEEHTSELQSRSDLVCRLLLEKKKQLTYYD